MELVVIEYLRAWVAVHAVAFFVLVVASFIGSFYALEALAAIDRRLRDADHKRPPTHSA